MYPSGLFQEFHIISYVKGLKYNEGTPGVTCSRETIHIKRHVVGVVQQWLTSIAAAAETAVTIISTKC